MKTIHFYIEVEDEKLGHPYAIDAKSEIFRGATDKVFFAQSPGIKDMSIIVCDRGIDENNSSATISIFPLPVNAEIVEEENNKKNEALERIESRLDTFAQQLITNYEAILRFSEICCENDTLKEYLNKFNRIAEQIHAEIKDATSANGISEKTLLNALEIVTRSLPPSHSSPE